MTESPRQHVFRLTERLSNPLDLYRHLPFRIAVVSNLLMLDRDLSIRSCSNLAPRELRILLNVGSYMPITSADIAYQTRIDSYTVSRAVSALHKQGYLTFEESLTNRRVKLLVLTEKGEKVYTKIGEQIDQRATTLGEALSTEETAEFLRMLSLLEDRAEQWLADQAYDRQQQGSSLPADQKELIRWRKKSTCGPR
ncbi:MarR family winged helix-turn-helix transcriptional regulator [Motiliproteus sp. MSK22-1]|uniref:MarR family winged helix-turn-helix transcriptional regulator n=1 Tax=Motiliproteus sp. MSK22-1 TaxID=1897630 RepID=UPI00097886A8|nr:MarR family winged helix-turn-helix transcriptional regulator [Motiliproteus sp. MSK22-1]OMH25581.1 hypothetical protein BGP75_23805 [Motiliproteus sp. MSK22-1]